MNISKIKAPDDLKEKTIQLMEEELNSSSRFKPLASVAMICILMICSVFAYDYFSSIKVNQVEIPPLDPMYNIKANKLTEKANEYGIISEKNLTGRLKFQKELGVSLLHLPSSIDNPYIIEKIQSDNEDYVILTLYNYVLGDTSDYNYNSKKEFYTYKKGAEYKTPLSLEIVIMLSEDQMKTGWNEEYLGRYTFEENFISKQGYRVNIIKTITNNNHIPTRAAIFVVDGIQYKLTGRTSLENFKHIIDKMMYE